jgi:hypothetical protein
MASEAVKLREAEKWSRLELGKQAVLLDHVMTTMEFGEQELQDHRRWTNKQLKMGDDVAEKKQAGDDGGESTMPRLVLGDYKIENHYHSAESATITASPQPTPSPVIPAGQASSVIPKPGILKKILPFAATALIGGGAASAIPFAIDVLTGDDKPAAVVSERYKVILDKTGGGE